MEQFGGLRSHPRRKHAWILYLYTVIIDDYADGCSWLAVSIVAKTWQGLRATLLREFPVAPCDEAPFFL